MKFNELTEIYVCMAKLMEQKREIDTQLESLRERAEELIDMEETG